MGATEIRTRFLNFFTQRGHAVVASSSLIPDDPSVLLTTAGMQQFKPYYTGQANPHATIHPTLGRPLGAKNAASIQKSFRTSDIDEVGDESHLTFFEMLGNFSFGGYFKEEAIRYACDFLQEVKLPIEFVTVFEGDREVPADAESEKFWRRLGVSDIRKRGRADNFWGPTGTEGPCGPTTEIYARGIEVWNIVFNEYYCRAGTSLEKLGQNGVDTGMGLERLAMALQDRSNIFETDLFAPLIALLPDTTDNRKKRIIVDHLRAACFLIADGVTPSNKGAGYILRRLLRRVFVFKKLPTQVDRQSFDTEPARMLQQHVLNAVMHETIHGYGDFYPELLKNAGAIEATVSSEWERFSLALARGIREFRTAGEITPRIAFELFQSYGLPLDSINDLIRETPNGSAPLVSEADFEREFLAHQEISRAGQERKFGGHGLLLDTGELKAADEAELAQVTRLHTATHLLNAALHRVLGESVAQRGSDITAERTRFDFLFPRKLTGQELESIEGLVNDAIEKHVPVTIEEMPLDEAKKSGALYFATGQYPERVKVYTIGAGRVVFSRELCGGPHVKNTGEIGKFKIAKEESSSAGVRRIRAIVEPSPRSNEK